MALWKFINSLPRRMNTTEVKCGADSLPNVALGSTGKESFGAFPYLSAGETRMHFPASGILTINGARYNINNDERDGVKNYEARLLRI